MYYCCTPVVPRSEAQAELAHYPVGGENTAEKRFSLLQLENVYPAYVSTYTRNVKCNVGIEVRLLTLHTHAEVSTSVDQGFMTLVVLPMC